MQRNKNNQNLDDYFNNKLDSDLKKIISPLLANSNSKENIILLTTGAFNPIHRMHLEILNIAYKHLISKKHNVLCALISPSADCYVKHKRKPFFPFEKRCEIIDESINDFYTENKNKDGLVFFGGVPKNYINNKYRYNCKVTEKYNFWSCELPYIYIGAINKYNNSENLYFTNKNYAYFNAAERRILAPKDFMSFLKINYFLDDLNNQNCKYYMYGHNHLFECKCEIKDKLPNISFIIGSYKYTFSSSELFINYGGGFCQFVIQENHLRENNFLIGTPFLQKFISNFDYETKYISFYSVKQLEQIDLEELFHPSHLVRNLVIIGIILLFIGVFFLTRKKLIDRKAKKELLLNMKSRGKEKIKEMNNEEEGYELN